MRHIAEMRNDKLVWSKSISLSNSISYSLLRILSAFQFKTQDFPGNVLRHGIFYKLFSYCVCHNYHRIPKGKGENVCGFPLKF